MNKDQLSALNDVVDASIEQLRHLLSQLGDSEEPSALTEPDLGDVQLIAERISEEAFNLTELLAAAQEEDYE